MTVIDDEFLVANDPLSLLTRLSQIASATPVIEEMKVVALDTPSNKITAMLEILEEMPEEQQVVVFSASRKLVDLAEGELRKKNISFVRITGAEDSKVKDMNAAYFQKGGARIALCTLGAASEGIDLFAADTAIFLNRSYKYIESGVGQQAESRIDRQGQTAERLTYIDLVSIGTVDEAVISALLSKGEMAEQVLRDHTRPLLQKKVTAS
jgi:SNF2 family DNA or RNA helicase